ncbi:hypothetical protein IVB69_05425 [Flavobacterium sp. J49]|uniref:hypothetical protein n=1 Tax=Flavobacterium sp. J49 TaxID=2718534 RepID=UPI0015941A98|nr:hypothetical protein [Flavobacterium sp. J49]MBF6640911.1 hypothetical protein [Flavobacterium sp. J49]NIC02158.1 hypothetical protein [Flavobacterium sp. J49]
MKKAIKIILFLIFATAIGIYAYRNSVRASVVEYQSELNPDDYPKTLDSIRQIRSQLKGKSTAEIGKSFTNQLTDKIFPYWYGTDWNFNGTSQKPNEGSIACGYFVTTTLRDIGVDINRVKLAQCASEEMIKKLVSEDNIYRFSNKNIQEFEKTLKEKGNGIYVVGLDNHTGFLYLSDEGNFFIHSSGARPFKVVKEKFMESTLLIKSKYRVAGKLSSDKQLLSNWIQL